MDHGRASAARSRTASAVCLALLLAAQGANPPGARAQPADPPRRVSGSPPGRPPAAPDWSRAVVESTLQRNPDPAQFGGWGYARSLYLMGQYFVYRRTHDERYLRYIRQWVDSHVNAEGTLDREINALDYVLPANLVLLLYQETGEARYKLAAEKFRRRFDSYPRTTDGGFWHATVESRQSQLWLDGIFMAMPFLVRYGRLFGDRQYANDEAARQILIYAAHTRDAEKGLLYHAYDESGKQPWADPATHHSAEFWGRAMGWYGMAIVDVLDVLPRSHPRRAELIAVLQRLVKDLVRYQDPRTGLWYQVVDKGEVPGNWLETSCSSMFTYIISVGVKRGYLDPAYRGVAERGYKGVLSKVTLGEDGLASISDISEGTSVADLAYYFGRKRNANDFHGLGAFLLMNEEYTTSVASMQQFFPPTKALEAAVRNPSRRARPAEDVVLQVSALRKLAPDFDPDTARLSVRPAPEPPATRAPGRATKANPAWFDLPFQADDLDGDGTVDEIAFQLDLAPGETRVVRIAYGGTVRPDFPARTHAKFAQKFDGLGWESERTAWRLYFDKRNAIDLFGKRKPGLYLEMFGEPDYRYQDESPLARDIFDVGKSAGIGAAGALTGATFSRIAEVAGRQWRIIAAGPVRTIVELAYQGWKVGSDSLDLTSRMTQWANERSFEHRVIATPPPGVTLAAALPHGPGFHTLAATKTCALATWGHQVVQPGAGQHTALPDQSLGLAVVLPGAERNCALTTDPDNYMVRASLRQGTAAWHVFAAWDQEPKLPGAGLRDGDAIESQREFDAWVLSAIDRLSHPAVVSLRTSLPVP